MSSKCYPIICFTDIPESLTVTEAIDNGYRTDQRTAIVVDLVPNTSYRFRIRAINEYGRGNIPSRPSGNT